MRSNFSQQQSPSNPDSEFRRIQELVYRHTAIVVTDDKIDFVRARIAKRLRTFNIESLGEYCDRVESGEETLEEFTSQMTTNHTSFFRESHHFDAMVKHLIATECDNTVIWSSACSSGEEPYSIAISLVENFQHRVYSGINILASDIDKKVLESAKTGIYSDEKVKDLSKARIRLALEPVSNPGPGYWQINKKIKNLVEFRQINLVQPMQVSRRVHIIFCRNVAIYFDRQTKVKLFNFFADLQRPGDLLFVGHSENLNELSKAYACIGGTAYKRL